MRVAIVHYWLVSMRGGEKVVEALCDLYPDADIFTLVYDPSRVSEKIRSHTVKTSFLQRIPGAVRNYQSLLPLMPFALESFDLSGYDLILSSESGPAKGIIPQPHTPHICYCHSPMRYIWDHYQTYLSTAGRLQRIAMPFMAPMLRSWDVNTSTRVDRFVANSHHVAARIRKYYRRPATVLYPPVNVGDFAPSREIGDFYLCAGQIVPYKRLDIAVAAFTKMGRNLVVIGEGKGIAELKRQAGPTVQFLGRVAFSELKDKLARCRALIFPGEEDFGIVPVEAMASGRPVIAFGSGGALETVVPGRTGILFDEQSVEALIDAVLEFEATERSFSPQAIRTHAGWFSEERFKSGMRQIIDEELQNERSHRAVTADAVTRFDLASSIPPTPIRPRKSARPPIAI
jgi:glycosyltransferase involved in cell wall biosynthesis